MSSDRKQCHCQATLHLMETRETRTSALPAHAHEGPLWVKPPPAPPCHGHQAPLLCGPLSPGNG